MDAAFAATPRTGPELDVVTDADIAGHAVPVVPHADGDPVAAPVRGGGPALLRPLSSPLRLPAAAAALVAGIAHLPVTPEHLDEVPYVGWMFVALAVVCVAGGLLLVVRDAAVVWWTPAVSCLAAVVLYVVSRGPGMPAMDDDIGDWTNEFGLISVASETLVAVLAVAALLRAAQGATQAARRLPLLLALSVPAAGLALAAGGYALGLAVAP